MELRVRIKLNVIHVQDWVAQLMCVALCGTPCGQCDVPALHGVEPVRANARARFAQSAHVSD